ELQWRQGDAGGGVRPRMGEGIDEIASGICLEAFQGHGTTGSIADEALQLIAPMRRDMGGGVHRKPLHAGTVGPGHREHVAHAPNLTLVKSKAGGITMNPFTLSLSEHRALKKQIRETKDVKVLKRAQAFLWLSGGVSIHEISLLLAVSRHTIYDWVSSYQNRC